MRVLYNAYPERECLICGSQTPSGGVCLRCHGVSVWMDLASRKNPDALISLLRQMLSVLEGWRLEEGGCVFCQQQDEVD